MSLRRRARSTPRPTRRAAAGAALATGLFALLLSGAVRAQPTPRVAEVLFLPDTDGPVVMLSLTADANTARAHLFVGGGTPLTRTYAGRPGEAGLTGDLAAPGWGPFGLPRPPPDISVREGPDGALLLTLVGAGPWQPPATERALGPSAVRARRTQIPPVADSESLRLLIARPSSGALSLTSAELFGTTTWLKGQVMVRRGPAAAKAVFVVRAPDRPVRVLQGGAVLRTQRACGEPRPVVVWIESDAGPSALRVSGLACLGGGDAVGQVQAEVFSPKGRESLRGVYIGRGL